MLNHIVVAVDSINDPMLAIDRIKLLPRYIAGAEKHFTAVKKCSTGGEECTRRRRWRIVDRKEVISLFTFRKLFPSEHFRDYEFYRFLDKTN